MKIQLINRIKKRLFGKVATPLYKREVYEGYKTIFENNSVAVLSIIGSNNECIISFTGVGHALGGIDLQNPEFSRSDGGETKIFVIDKERSWGNNINWNQLYDNISPVIQDMQITTLGNSMGGFLAILSARMLNADRTIAFVPQWSIDPEIIPNEHRWKNYRKKIGVIKYKDLSNAFVSSTKFSVFFGRDKNDANHLQLFPSKKDNIDMIVLEDCHHNAARFLKECGQLYPTIKACQEGEDVKLLLRKAGIRLA